ncbi:hypothetical protein HDE_00426 [Halotydeus destructor]|nr:hypothetical protein HDE_00426 [Halotydeus destructor]
MLTTVVVVVTLLQLCVANVNYVDNILETASAAWVRDVLRHQSPENHRVMDTNMTIEVQSTIDGQLVFEMANATIFLSPSNMTPSHITLYNNYDGIVLRMSSLPFEVNVQVVGEFQLTLNGNSSSHFSCNIITYRPVFRFMYDQVAKEIAIDHIRLTGSSATNHNETLTEAFWWQEYTPCIQDGGRGIHLHKYTIWTEIKEQLSQLLTESFKDGDMTILDGAILRYLKYRNSARD